MKIIIAEDDHGLNSGIAYALQSSGYETVSAFCLADIPNEGDLLILDINFPNGSGFDYLKKLRETSRMPVVILTANDLETDEVRGLSLGADDYITKPFSLMVLRARIEKILGRQNIKEMDVFISGSLKADFAALKFTVCGRETELSKTEIKLLKLLLTNKNRTLTRDMLIDRIWSEGAEFVDENALSVTVNRLRKKLGENGAFLKTVYGIGYSWKEGQ